MTETEAELVKQLKSVVLSTLKCEGDEEILGRAREAFVLRDAIATLQPPFPRERGREQAERARGAFREWLSGASVELCGVEPRTGADGRYALVCTRDLDPEERVLRVPLSALLLTRPRDLDDAGSVIGGFALRCPLLRSMEMVQLGLVLLAERARGPASPFAPYIDVLPRAFDHLPPVSWSVGEIGWLRGSPAFSLATERALNLLGYYALLCDNGLREAAGTLAEFLWAMSVAMTRQNRIVVGSAEEQGGAPIRALGLIPALDLCEHDPRAPPSLGQDPDSLSVDCLSHRRFARGETLTVHYGPRSDAELLVYSGFVSRPPGGNPNTRAEVEIDVGADLAGVKRGVLRDLAGIRAVSDHRYAVVIGEAGEVAGLRAVARAARVSSEEDAVRAVLATARGDESLTPDEHRILIHALEEALSGTQAALSRIRDATRQQAADCRPEALGLAAELREAELVVVRRTLDSIRS